MHNQTRPMSATKARSTARSSYKNHRGQVGEKPVLRDYDRIVINSSAGKDSQAMLDVVVEQARAGGVADRLVVFHADLGRVEWQGTKELAEEQARHYGIRFESIARPQGDLLTHIRQRGMFPSPTRRYCTSDHKRCQAGKLHTALAAELRSAREVVGRPVRLLNCMGFRAEESVARARRPMLERDGRQWTANKQVTNWLPILHWTEPEVWARIACAGTRYHPAYDLGMPRLSCCFCIFAPRSALMIAGQANPELLAEYVDLERDLGHQFRGQPGSNGNRETGPIALAEIAQALALARIDDRIFQRQESMAPNTLAGDFEGGSR